MAQWNSNGIINHKEEIEIFLEQHKIDILIISETHLTSRNNFKIYGYACYANNHPDDKSCGGTAILIKNRLRHYPLPNIQTRHIQSTAICVTEFQQELTIISIYCPPKYILKTTHFTTLFKNYKGRFLMAGDFNAKSPLWGSRLTSPKGKQLEQAIRTENLHCISGGEPTYWPTDRRKIPDIIDFSIVRYINPSQIKATTMHELSSDHSPILITLNLNNKKPPESIAPKTNWQIYQNKFKKIFCPNIKLQTTEDIDNALAYFQDTIDECIELAAMRPNKQNHNLPPTTNDPSILQLLATKRKAKRHWQKCRSPKAKEELNTATKNLKRKLIETKNNGIQNYVEQLTHHPDNYHSVWKTIKNIKKPIMPNPPLKNPTGNWLITDKEKCEEFANHLGNTFTPNAHIPLPLEKIGPANKNDKLTTTLQEVTNLIHSINIKKAPGPDQITGRALKSLPMTGHIGLRNIFNAIFRLGYFPHAWKQSNIIMIPKPGKDPSFPSSYRPISLLPIISKLFEKAFLTNLQKDLDTLSTIPQHQFGFRRNHGTIEQIHRIVNQIKKALENQSICVGVFLDVAQAFDKVNHNGLLEKIYEQLPLKYHKLLKSYLQNRQFKVTHRQTTSSARQIQAGVPQGSVLGPILYLLYTSDLPTHEKIMTSTFADDTAILCTHKNPTMAHQLLQKHINEISRWCDKWGIKLNETKSTLVSFSLRKSSCPPIKLNQKNIPQSNSTKYLGIHLDRRLTWSTHILKKKEQLSLIYRKMHWLLGKKSKLKLETKIILYKSVIKPIWTYGIQLWGSAKTSNTNIIERSQTKIIRSIIGAPRYVRNTIMLRDLKIPTVKEEAKNHSIRYIHRLTSHPNTTARQILVAKRFNRLKRADPLSLAD